MSAVEPIERRDPDAQDIPAIMRALGVRARAAALELAKASSARKDAALRTAAAAIRSGEAKILAANARDLAEAKSADFTPAFADRLTLD
ncbi:MAG TPA: gamma-glutamyl-phosphate reductase, partial [Alphaproteobacteria bacterium]